MWSEAIYVYKVTLKVTNDNKGTPKYVHYNDMFTML